MKVVTTLLGTVRLRRSARPMASALLVSNRGCRKPNHVQFWFVLFNPPSEILQEFLPTEKLRKGKSLLNASRRGRSRRAQGVGSLLHLDLSAGFNRQTHRKPSRFPHLKPGQEEVASAAALDLKQFQTSFTVCRLRPEVDFPLGCSKGEEQPHTRWVPGQDPARESPPDGRSHSWDKAGEAKPRTD